LPHHLVLEEVGQLQSILLAARPNDVTVLQLEGILVGA
jgi:hypothetical protein